MSGKGDHPRPLSVTPDEYGARFAATFQPVCRCGHPYEAHWPPASAAERPCGQCECVDYEPARWGG